MKKICIFGLGYIGLPTGCLFASHGYQVLGIDIKPDIVEKVNRGIAPFEEPGLQELLVECHRNHSLKASAEAESADVFLIAVPTPMDNNTGTAGLQAVSQAAESISRYLKKGCLVVVESTVPPMTCEKMVVPILEQSGLRSGEDFSLAYCPERAIPSDTLREMVHNDRIVGGLDKKSADLTKDLYSCFVKGHLYATNLRTAAMVKLIENTYRDINIALANEFAGIAEKMGVNIWDAITLANRHPRVKILSPGPGVGGHCLTKDPLFLAENTISSRIIEMAREINDSMPRHVLNYVDSLIGTIPNGIITVLGIAYKANVDDTRETPALKLIKLAENVGYRVKIFDPWVKKFEYPLLSLEESAKDSDCIVLITDHSAFKDLDPFRLASLMRNKNLVDTRFFLDHKKWEEAGFRVKILGDGTKNNNLLSEINRIERPTR
jgi:UDP-N-acetyl-D-mannosaminuronic acid dehydrogenase